LIVEDTSFQWEEDEEAGQIILKGLGELHLETIKNRIMDEYSIDLKLSKMRVALRESVSRWTAEDSMFEKSIRGRKEFFAIGIEVGPNESANIDLE
jgi:elongation factor G